MLNIVALLAVQNLFVRSSICFMLLLKLPPCPSNKVHALNVQREGPLDDAGSLYFPGCRLFPRKPYGSPTQLGACL
jgi:hypothetical protein